ncbi:hypothetical protein B0H11DRAFT_1734152, partial [Mycena galericulata]
FAEKLNTNYVPSDVEIREIRAFMVEHTGGLNRLDAQIDEMETRIAELRAARKSLKDFIDAHRALTSPIRRLPQDILFAFCLPTQCGSLVDTSEAPLVLGHICTYWRYVVCHTPNLWTSMRISIYDGLEHKPEVMETWLARSGASPLSILLNSLPPPWPDGEHNAVVKSLLRVSCRIQHLRLASTAFAGGILPILMRGAQDLPFLKSLTIQAWNSGTLLHHATIFRTPNLQHITLNGFQSDLTTLPISWEQLTGFTTDNSAWSRCNERIEMNIEHTLNVLSQCHGLVYCRLHIPRATSTPFVVQPAITLQYF